MDTIFDGINISTIEKPDLSM